MKKRLLGNTGIEVSEIAFGGVEIGMPYGIGVTNKSDMLSEKEAIQLLHQAVDSGINFFDTARMYGESERIMGKAFQDRREKVVIATKCSHLLDANGNLTTGETLKKTIEKSLQESLQALSMDYVDIFMLHQADSRILESEDVLNTFSKLKDQGLFRIAGVSTYTIQETEKALENSLWKLIQLPFNLMDQRQEKYFKKAHQQGVGIVIRSILLKGLLSNRGKNLHPALANVEKHITQYDKLLEGTNYTLSTLATKFGLSFPEVASVLVGIDKKEYLEQSLKTADGVYLDQKQLSEAKSLGYPDPEFLNLPYWDKMNWLK